MQDQVCVPNTLQWDYADKITGHFVKRFSSSDEMAHLCTLKLSESFKTLQPFLKRTIANSNGSQHNLAITQQSECPENISLLEFKALCSMPLGRRISWMNLLVQLAMPAVDWKRAEVAIFAMHISEQVGAAYESTVRENHAVLIDTNFAESLGSELQLSLQRLKGNWESCKAVWIFTFLAARLLSAGPKETHQQFLDILTTARSICVEWMRLLEDKSTSSVGNAERAEYLQKLCEVSLVCLSSFDVEGVHLQELLSREGTTTIYLESSIRVQQTLCIELKEDFIATTLIARWKRLASRALPTIMSGLNSDNALGNAIGRIWRNYALTQPWELVKHPWVKTIVSDGEMRQIISIDFNLLTAELLINGSSWSRLPREYEMNEEYKALFGTQPLDVMPTSEPGMLFETRSTFSGYRIFFRLLRCSISDLVLRARKDDMCFDKLPTRLFSRHFPSSFHHDYTPWYNQAGNSIEFRPLASPWIPQASNSRLEKTGNCWNLKTHDGGFLVNPSSDTAQRIFGIMSAVENVSEIHIYYYPVKEFVSITLPRLKLAFRIECGSCDIISRQFKSMKIDQDQNIGTLIGLKNKLVLRKESDMARMVLIPEGNVAWDQSDESCHISVSIDVTEAKNLQAYRVDPHLGRLKDNGSLQSKLFLSYLHAVTSFCLPDPFTGLTGTEQALKILNSGAVRSFHELTQDNIVALTKISELTANRHFNSVESPSTEIVRWEKHLSPLSQHCGFFKIAGELLQQGGMQRMFNRSTKLPFPELKSVSGTLARRAEIRLSAFCTSGFGAERFTRKLDRQYTRREAHEEKERGVDVFNVCSNLIKGKDKILGKLPREFPTNILQAIKSETTKGGSTPILRQELRYSALWLDAPCTILPDRWCGIHQAFINDSKEKKINKYDVMMWLATMAFAIESHESVMQALTGIASLPALTEAAMSPPTQEFFDLTQGYKPQKEKIRRVLKRCIKTGRPSLRGNSKKTLGETPERYLEEFMKANDWPKQQQPRFPEAGDYEDDININSLERLIRDLFETWRDNLVLKDYVNSIKAILKNCKEFEPECFDMDIKIPKYVCRTLPRYMTISKIFKHYQAPSFEPLEPMSLADALVAQVASKPHQDLNNLVERMSARATTEQRRHYVQSLCASVQALGSQHHDFELVRPRGGMKEILQSHLEDCRAHLDKTIKALIKVAGPTPHDGAQTKNRTMSSLAIVRAAVLWPRLPVSVLLEQLNRDNRDYLPRAWKEAIVHLGTSLTRLQHAERLLSFIHHEADLIRELQHGGERNWSPMENPDALLMEIEGDFRIRHKQEDIAREMRSRPSGKNAVMQLNMGEGKSSVIVPMVAASLADGSRLVRVIVAKPQAKQMCDLLLWRLGGLIGRRIYRMPFTRTLKLQVSEANKIDKLCHECMAQGGVLLMLPEHILSFQLMAIESLINGQQELGNLLLNSWAKLKTQSQDIVDESDENFSPQFELVYTMGQQSPLEFGPERWKIILQVMAIAAKLAPKVKEQVPRALELQSQPKGRFPRLRLLGDEARAKLREMIAQEICERGITGLGICRQSQETRRNICLFITKPEPDRRLIEAVKAGAYWTDATKDALLLLRGLLAGDVLSYALSHKRWRVNFGLDSERVPRTKLAVPYRAKDMPSQRAEFSHPDTVMVLTSLCYYYGGLSNDDLFDSLTHLSKSDQASIEYNLWTSCMPDLEPQFRNFEGINLRDKEQCLEKIFPRLKFSMGAINYFLCEIVFPKEMREFPQKLAASGWDIGRSKHFATTGFSGTNDSQHLLPLSVEQVALPSEEHTNALVLSNILCRENDVVTLSELGHGGICSGNTLLKLITQMTPQIRVILDVGAQIVEMTNEQVSRTWLHLLDSDEGVEAVVFCDGQDELVVLDRCLRIEPLQSSPFAKQLDACLVFLDEAHTRGIDLKLPDDYRAAVTLGANLTKDRLVQACMRMRKLGAGQTLVFCVPEEIETKIRCRRIDAEFDDISVADIIDWAVGETWEDIRRLMPLWAAQGRRFEEQNNLWLGIEMAEDGVDVMQQLGREFLEDEARSMESRYDAGFQSAATLRDLPCNEENMKLIRQRCKEFDCLGLGASQMQEQQERQLTPEVERERQVERGHSVEAAKHRLSAVVKRFIQTGKLEGESGTGWIWAFESLQRTSAAACFNVESFPHSVRVSKDFAVTMQGEAKSRQYGTDGYQRNVQWLLTGCNAEGLTKTLLIISPYEAECHLDSIRASPHVQLHLYAPRQNVAVKPLDDLRLFTMRQPDARRHVLPNRLRIALNLFSGQLYFSSYQDYVDTCDYLCLAWSPLGDAAQADGFISIGERRRIHGGRVNFSQSPVQFLKMLMAKIRRHGGNIDKTHVGKMLDGVFLTEEDFEPRATRRIDEVEGVEERDARRRRAASEATTYNAGEENEAANGLDEMIVCEPANTPSRGDAAANILHQMDILQTAGHGDESGNIPDEMDTSEAAHVDDSHGNEMDFSADANHQRQKVKPDPEMDSSADANHQRQTVEAKPDPDADPSTPKPEEEPTDVEMIDLTQPTPTPPLKPERSPLPTRTPVLVDLTLDSTDPTKQEPQSPSPFNTAEPRVKHENEDVSTQELIQGVSGGGGEQI
ncbi:hypothetical protein CDD81_4126 [Ophiocordyceps australis]|uniref:ubiquitinyl hydrolase 1 n=1 Tax=Ophiocordyceps australis TaxID=1399860 RepID=A0A2C5Y5B8_9HYPO|nr:hypothetical protein CDD81_4126 [Ophiocordyceps australis]